MKRRIFFALILILAGLLSLALSPEPEHSQSGFAMNTLINMRMFSRNPEPLNDAYNLLAKLDSELSMYNPSSDISRINFLAGREKFSAPSEVVEVISDAKELYEITGGIFNPLIGAVTNLWKINQTDGKMPTQASLDVALNLSDINNLEISGNEIFLKHAGCVLDLGGIAKGFASEKIAGLLKSKGVKSGIVDLGGNVYAIGTRDGEDWRIGVRDPISPRGVPALVVNIQDCAVITSGNYERYKIIDGKKYSHFFNPKTGESVLSDMLSVTLVTPDGSMADGLATAFMISGYDEAVRISKKLPPHVGVIIIRRDDEDENSAKVFASTNLREKITRSRYEINYF